ncbi:MAG: heme-binding protein [Haloarculaceae archaeon]
MDARRPPATEEGWYALHDFRTIDWDAWREAPERERERAIEEGVAYLEEATALADAAEGGSALFAITGHKADLMILHLRPTLAAVERLERRFEGTALSGFTEQPSSYVSVTEVSGYMHEDITDGVDDIEDAGLRNYIKSRLHPEIPDAEHVCFYPMDKRRGPEDNWYDLAFEERADLMSGHGDIGREYAGKVTQIITGSVGLDDHEWGVTLFADDLVDVKHLLYEMRFDPSSSRYAEFGDFYVGRRFPPADLDAYLAGEHVPAGADGDDAGADTVDAELAALGLDPGRWAGDHALVYYSAADVDDLREEVEGMRSNFEHYDRHVHTSVEIADDGRAAIVSVWTAAEAADTAGGFLADLPGVEERLDGPVGGDAPDDADDAASTAGEDDGIRGELADRGIYAGQPHGEDVYAMVLYSEADPADLAEAVDGLRENFEHYDTHVKTAVYRARSADRTAVVSIWETESAADTAGGFLADLPGVVDRAPAADGDASGFGTMGMFYTVEPDHREAFVEKFEAVGDLLDDMEGHHETDLMVNVADENDMFIASRWRSRGDAMAFFRSDDFSETVSWGRDVLADRPRHVFLA